MSSRETTATTCASPTEGSEETKIMACVRIRVLFRQNAGSSLHHEEGPRTSSIGQTGAIPEALDSPSILQGWRFGLRRDFVTIDWMYVLLNSWMKFDTN